MVFALQVSRAPNVAGGTLSAGNPAIGANQPSSLRYMHHDHLGSVAAVTNETGAVLERLAFDPWGKRRNINGKADTTDALVGLTTDRGYTEHEHLDEMGVIHMNGRIYDPLVGRMMSADPFIQAPSNLQSYNRYSYVMNNPLNLTDPTGYSWLDPLNIRGTVRAAGNILASPTVNNAFYLHRSMPGIQAVDSYVQRNTWAYALGSAVAYYYAGGLGVSLHAAYNARVATGSANAAFRVGAISLATSIAFSAVGANFEAGSVGSYLGHAAVGCASTAAQGGNCGTGAVSALFGKFATNATANWGNDIGHFAITVVAGGVGSVIAGGKFENGAKTAAYGYLFNYCLSSTTGCWVQKGMNALKIAGGSAGFAVGVATCGVTFGLGCAAAIESGNQVIEGATYFANAGAEEGFKPSKAILQSVFGESTGSHINTGLEVGTALQNAGAPVALKGFSLFRPDMSTRIQQMGTLQLGVTTGSTAGKLLSDPYYRD
jgi:RHS repeat-associated protein